MGKIALLLKPVNITIVTRWISFGAIEGQKGRQTLSALFSYHIRPEGLECFIKTEMASVLQ